MSKELSLAGMTEEYVELLDQLADGFDPSVEGDESRFEELLSRFRSLEGTMEQKVEASINAVRFLEAAADSASKMAKQLSAVAKARGNAAEGIRRYVGECLGTSGKERVRTAVGTAYFTHNKRTVVDDPDALPEEFVVVERKPSLQAIKAACELGREVAGAHIEVTRSIAIR